ncbi:regulatory GntR family protein [Bacillus mycoides]|uniref:Regulatory GntR family protein n=1 Tax=Bacillus mycoides TaxID=1405 RepID=A0A3D9VE64_BACMY|nr:regulatory GntR family protein [Bacillus sp. DB-2]REF39787.1 regulatory GntR family protein [Bacillus mycoides]
MSWKPDKNLLKRPFYSSIAILLEHDIINGLLAPGTKLPPQRELEDFLDLNFTTITRAYKICEVKNYNDSTGLPHQKMAGLNWMSSFGINVTQEHIAIVSGAQNTLAITLTALFKPGNRIATDLYTYSNFIELAKMLPDELDKQCSQLSITLPWINY